MWLATGRGSDATMSDNSCLALFRGLFRISSWIVFGAKDRRSTKQPEPGQPEITLIQLILSGVNETSDLH